MAFNVSMASPAAEQVLGDWLLNNDPCTFLSWTTTVTVTKATHIQTDIRLKKVKKCSHIISLKTVALFT